MLILPDTAGITIKRTIQSENYVRIGIFETSLCVDGIRRSVRLLPKSSVEFTIGDCTDLLEELESLVRMIS